MPEPITLHDPTLWQFLFDTISIQGFGDGDALSMEPPTELVMAKRGVMGEYALALKTDKLHSFKINLHQTSATNGVLRARFRSQFFAGWAPKVLSVYNRSTGETYRGIGWLASDAPWKVSEAVQNCEWDFGFIVDEYTPPA